MSRNIEINIKTQDASTQETQYEVLYPKNTAKNVVFNPDSGDNVTVYDKLNNITPNNSFELGDILLTSKVNVDLDKWARCDGRGLNTVDYSELSNIIPITTNTIFTMKTDEVVIFSSNNLLKYANGIYVIVTAEESVGLQALVTTNPFSIWNVITVDKGMKNVTGLNFINDTWYIFANLNIYKTQNPFGTWESISTNLSGSYICDMAYYDGVYVGVGYAGSGWDSWVGYSTNLTTWTTKYLIRPSKVSSIKTYAVTVNNGIWMALLNGNKLFKSSTPKDNNSWIQVFVEDSSSDRYGGAITGIIYYEGKYIMSSYINTKAIIYSTNDDFTTWDTLYLADDITFLVQDEYDNKFYGMYSTSSSGETNVLYSSDNPTVEWTSETLSFNASYPSGLAVYKKLLTFTQNNKNIWCGNCLVLPYLTADKSKYYIKVKN